jgi:small subunit ribosomal protein S17
MNNRRRITGFVTSNAMQKTVVVEISRSYRHPLYKKVIHSRKRVMAHDELVESRPISKNKRWVVEQILRRSVGGGEEAVEA